MSDFKRRHFLGEVTLRAARLYCRHGASSYRDLDQMMGEQGVLVDHSTIYRRFQNYAPEIVERFLGKAPSGLKDWEKPTVINTDKAPACGIAILELEAEGRCPKELVRRSASGLRTLKTAHAAIKSFEVMRVLRKAQASIFNLIDDIRRDARIVERAFGVGPSAPTEVAAIPARNPDAKAA